MTAVERMLSEQLSEFFEKFTTCRSQVDAPAVQRQAMDLGAFAEFMSSLEQPLIAARLGAFQFDPWEVAGLGYDEVRNTSVLAWLLNPQGSHGLGITAMNGLLAMVNRTCRSNFDSDLSIAQRQLCRVRTEINPSGEISDRVDIEVDAENFYLIIEAKIRAPEQPGQMERYCRQAKVRAGSRPWAVIYLTPQGRPPESAGEYSNTGHVVQLSWKKLAISLEKELPESQRISGQSISISHLFAMQAVRCFLKKIRSF